MAGRGSKAPFTPSKLWDDGLHFVRPASNRDNHPMRWVVSSHAKATGSSMMRHVPTLDEGILRAMAATTALLERDPSLQARFKVPTMPPAATLQGARLPALYRVAPPEPPKVIPKFAVTHFNCIRANPVAQVWQCVTLPGETAPVGRRKAGGGVATQTPFNHTKGECAVMLWREPVRTKDGAVRVFPSWQSAEEFANDCYYAADEEDRLSWVEDGTVVYRTENVDILFDPSVNGVKRPFSLWLPKWRKPVYEGFKKKNYTTAAQLASGGSYIPGTADAKAAHDFNRKLEAMDDNRTLTVEIATFKSIWGAEEHATNVTEKVLRGEQVSV